MHVFCWKVRYHIDLEFNRYMWIGDWCYNYLYPMSLSEFTWIFLLPLLGNCQIRCKCNFSIDTTLSILCFWSGSLSENYGNIWNLQLNWFYYGWNLKSERKIGFHPPHHLKQINVNILGFSPLNSTNWASSLDYNEIKKNIVDRVSSWFLAITKVRTSIN